MLTRFVTSLWLLTSVTAASAAVLQVANNGLDGTSCGTKTAPCRSITRAVANAAPGDRIVVGPGRYGDLDRDGVLGEPNEEGPAAGTILALDKAVSVESSAGAASTIIDAGDSGRSAVRITASGARLGRSKKGFTLVSSAGNGVEIQGAAAGAVVEGNLALLTLSAFLGAGAGGHVLQGNVAVANASGFVLGNGENTVARANLAVANTSDGFTAGGTGTPRLEGNVATGNEGFGFSAALYDHVTLTGGVAVGNAQGVFGGNGDTFAISGLTALANVVSGIHNQGTTTMSVTASNLVANGAKSLGGFANCGAATEAHPLAATNVFWGAASGPGDDPADRVCELAAGVATVDSVATKPFKSKTKVPQL